MHITKTKRVELSYIDEVIILGDHNDKTINNPMYQRTTIWMPTWQTTPLYPPLSLIFLEKDCLKPIRTQNFIGAHLLHSWEHLLPTHLLGQLLPLNILEVRQMRCQKVAHIKIFNVRKKWFKVVRTSLWRVTSMNWVLFIRISFWVWKKEAVLSPHLSRLRILKPMQFFLT